MSFPTLVAVLRARRVSAFVVLLLIVGLVAAWLASQPRRYTATASVLVDVKSPDPVAGMVLQGLTLPSYMLTQVDVLQSLRTAERVSQALQLERDPAWRERWRRATQGRVAYADWLAAMLRDGLDARPSRGSNVIAVSFTSEDPVFAAQAANAFVQAYIDVSMELRVEPAREYSRNFEAHAERLRHELEERQARLSAYQLQKGLIVMDARLDTETSRLAELTSQLVALQGATSTSANRRDQARRRAERMQEVLTSPGVIDAKAAVARIEARREELGTRLGDLHPQVIEAESALKGARARLQSEVARAAGSVAVDDEANHARLAELKAAIEQQRAKVMALGVDRDEAAVLRQDVENAQRAYDAVVTRLNQTSLEGQTAQANASALERAVAPALPSSPRLRAQLGLGLLGGLVAGVAVALLRERGDRRLRVLADLALPELEGAPRLVSLVPDFAPPRRLLGFSLPRVFAARRDSGERVAR